MLTVILLVVLAGGAAALAVWLVDPSGVRRLLGRTGALSLRAPQRRDTALSDLPGRSEPVPSTGPTDGMQLEVVATRGAPAPLASVGRAQRRSPGAVPAAFTAVEGTYDDVAVAPASRKVLSVVALTALVLVAGVMLAAVAAAVLAAAAELVDGAVG